MTARSTAPSSTITYTWPRDGKKIRGATKRTYVVTAKDRGHRLAVKVLYKSPGYAPLARTVKVGTVKR